MLLLATHFQQCTPPRKHSLPNDWIALSFFQSLLFEGQSTRVNRDWIMKGRIHDKWRDSFIKLQVPFQTSYIIFIFIFFWGFFQTVNDHQLNILLCGFCWQNILLWAIVLRCLLKLWADKLGAKEVVSIAIGKVHLPNVSFGTWLTNLSPICVPANHCVTFGNNRKKQNSQFHTVPVETPGICCSVTQPGTRNTTKTYL